MGAENIQHARIVRKPSEVGAQCVNVKWEGAWPDLKGVVTIHDLRAGRTVLTVTYSADHDDDDESLRRGVAEKVEQFRAAFVSAIEVACLPTRGVEY